VLPGTSATIRFRLVNNDQDTGTSVSILDVLVPTDNKPPVVAAIADQGGAEGSAVNVVGSFTDPDAGDTHTAVFTWGDGSSSAATISPGPNGSFVASASHVYADNGSYAAQLSVTDSVNAPASAAFHVNVGNVAPSVTAGLSFRAASVGSTPAVE